MLEVLETNRQKKTSTIKTKILELIKGASQNVKICSFLIDDKDIIDALIAKAKKLRGRVYCITIPELHSIQKIYDLDYGDLMEIENPTDLRIYREDFKHKALARLSNVANQEKAAVAIRGMEGAHAKFLIVDRKRAVITSANFKHSSLNYIDEIGVFTDDKGVVKALNEIFNDAYYKQYDTYYGFGNESIVRRQVYTYPKSLPLPNYQFPAQSKSGYRLIWTYDCKNGPRNQNFSRLSIQDAAMRLVNEESKKIDIFAFKFANLDGSPFFKALEKKLNQSNVQVRILSKQNFFDRLPDQIWVQKCSKWAKGGGNFKIRFRNYFHAKGIITTTGILLTSANFDQLEGIKGNFETGIIMRDPSIVSAGEKFFNRVWERAIPPSLFECPVNGCNGKFRSQILLNRHLRETHRTEDGIAKN